MKPSDVAALLGIATSTIRTWTMGEFKQYLSPTGQGGDGKYRNFTERDARIIALINELKRENTPLDDIHGTLKRLQTEDWIDLPPMPPAPPGISPIRMVPELTAETAISTQRHALLREISILQERVEGLEEQLRREKERREEELLKAQEGREELLREIADLQRRLGESDVELKLYRSGRLKPDNSEK